MASDHEIIFGKEFANRIVAEGMRAVFPAENEIQIDIDSEADYERFQKLYGIFTSHVGVMDKVERPSKSGLPRRHITIAVNYSMGHWERLAWQAALGSDPTREILSCIQLTMGDDRPIVFTELPLPVGKKKAKRRA